MFQPHRRKDDTAPWRLGIWGLMKMVVDLWKKQLKKNGTVEDHKQITSRVEMPPHMGVKRVDYRITLPGNPTSVNLLF